MDPLIVKATIQAVTLSALSNIIAQLLSSYQEGKPYGLDLVVLGRFVTFSLLSCPPNVLWQRWLEGTYPGYTTVDTPGTSESIARQPTVKAMSEKAAPIVQVLNEKTAAVAAAFNEDESVQGIKRRATEGVDKVRAKAREIDARSGPDLSRRSSVKLNSSGRAQTFSASNGRLDEKSSETESVSGTQTKTAGDKKLNIKNTAIKFALDQTFGAIANTVLFIGGMSLLKGEPFSKALAAVHHDTLPLLFAGQKLWPAVSIISFTLVPLEHRTVFGGIIGVGWGIFLSLLAGGTK